MKRQGGSPSVGWHGVALALVVLFVIVVRIRLLDVPLERDEGEFAYVGQLMLDGVAPYKMAYVIKLPGTAAVYAVSMALFGQTTAAIHLGLLLANVAAIVLVFLLAKKWFGAGVAVMAGVTYALMSLSWAVYGNAAHATQFVVPAALGGILLLLRGLDSGRPATLFWSGLLFGLAFLLKQPGLVFGAFGGFLLLDNELKTRPVQWMRALGRAAIFCLGIILPFAVLCLILWRAGAFGKFWHWSFVVAGGGWVSLREGWDDFIWFVNRLRASGQLPFWILAGLALPFVFCMGPARKVRLIFPAFCCLSIFAGGVGLYFNPHYFVLTLPAVGMTIGLGIMEARRLLQNSKSLPFASFLPALLFCVVCGGAVLDERGYLFTLAPGQISARIYPGNPFREAAQVADYIRRHSAADSRIAVLGSEPEIYFDAHRRSATGHVSTYILMEDRPYSHALQEEMVREITSAGPEYIVFVNNVLSWFPRAHPDNTLLEAMARYEKDHYNRVGVVLSGPAPAPPVYYWDAAAANLSWDADPRRSSIFVYERQKPAGPAAAKQ